MFALQNQYIVFETSASTGVNVNEMFAELSKHILVTSKSELTEMKADRESIVLFEQPDANKKKKKKSSWC